MAGDGGIQFLNIPDTSIRRKEKGQDKHDLTWGNSHFPWPGSGGNLRDITTLIEAGGVGWNPNSRASHTLRMR